MIKSIVFEFTTSGGKGILSDFLRKHPALRAATDVRINDLRQHGVGSEETLRWCPHEKRGIYKLKVRTTPEFRPHLCKGPFDMNAEATVLATAIEERFELEPTDVLDRAVERRDILKREKHRRSRYGRD
jgi:hypothetical protein